MIDVLIRILIVLVLSNNEFCDERLPLNPTISGALSLETSSRVAMMRSVTILSSFLVTLSQGEDFSLEQIGGALIIMVTIVLNANESTITESCPKLNLICPSCRIDQMCYRRVSTIDNIEAAEPVKDTKE